MPGSKGVLDEFEDEFAPEEQAQEDVLNGQQQNADDQNGQQQDDAGQQQDDTQDGGVPNREHRRTSKKLLEEKRALQEVRRLNIEEAERLRKLKEEREHLGTLGSQSVDERLLTLYGNDDAGQKAARITQSLLEDTAKRARAEALEDFREQQRQAEREIQENQQFIDTALEDLEDLHGIDLTSNAPAARKARDEFLTMVERFSPKDADGNITEYADFSEVYDVFSQSRKSDTVARQKNLASRGQVQSGGSTQIKAEDKATERALRDAGII